RAAAEDRLDPLGALPLELDVPDGEHLVDEEDVRLHVGGDGEPEAADHAGRVGPEWRVDEVSELRELDRHGDRKSTRLNSSHGSISYAVFCLKKKKKTKTAIPRKTRST